MFSRQLGKHVQTVLVALATLALTAGNSVAVVINFEELADEAGILVSYCQVLCLAG
jgi:hypothetical protein